MAATKLSPAATINRLYKFRKPDILDDHLRSKLPEAYKKFYREWKLTLPSPVHYKPKEGKYELNPKTGQVRTIQNVPIIPIFPLESHQGLWGGEGVVKGFSQKRKRYQSRVPNFWVPFLKRGVIYSEILDKYMTTIVTERTINLIMDHHGLDNYLLKTKAYDIQSGLGLKLKRKMLIALLEKDLYIDDPQKQEAIYNKYKHFLDEYTKEEIEWYGLTEYEALHKLETNELEAPKVPKKYQLRENLLNELKQKVIDELSKEDQSEKPSWITKMNPFSKKQS